MWQTALALFSEVQMGPDTQSHQHSFECRRSFGPNAQREVEKGNAEDCNFGFFPQSIGCKRKL
eukprot:3378250-Amphidinium_carterae.1